MKLRTAYIYFALYVAGAGTWAMLKVSAGCPCGWIADCIKCGIVSGIMESFTLWGVVAVVLAIPIVVLVLVVSKFHPPKNIEKIDQLTSEKGDEEGADLFKDV